MEIDNLLVAMMLVISLIPGILAVKLGKELYR